MSDFKKILFLVHPEADFGEYFLYAGLCELLGEENIVLYPPKLSYLGIKDKHYVLDGGKRGSTAPASYVKARSSQIWTLEEVIERIAEFDFMVLSSPRTYATRALRFIRKHFNGNPIPLVFCDHEDSMNIRSDLINEFKPNVIFKRELTHKVEGVYPLPFSCTLPYIDDKFDDAVKNNDIFAAFGFTCQFRKDVVEFLLNKDLGKTCTAIDIPRLVKENNYPKMFSYHDYLEKIAKSKIAISIRGHGRDTVRYWEIPFFETLFMVKDPELIIPYPFEDKKHCVYFNDLSDLEEKIKYYLNHDEERITIAKAGKEHLLKYHTNKARAEQFLKIIKEII